MIEPYEQAIKELNRNIRILKEQVRQDNKDNDDKRDKIEQLKDKTDTLLKDAIALRKDIELEIEITHSDEEISQEEKEDIIHTLRKKLLILGDAIIYLFKTIRSLTHNYILLTITDKQINMSQIIIQQSKNKMAGKKNWI